MWLWWKGHPKCRSCSFEKYRFDIPHEFTPIFIAVFQERLVGIEIQVHSVWNILCCAVINAFVTVKIFFEEWQIVFKFDYICARMFPFHVVHRKVCYKMSVMYVYIQYLKCKSILKLPFISFVHCDVGNVCRIVQGKKTFLLLFIWYFLNGTF